MLPVVGRGRILASGGLRGQSFFLGDDPGLTNFLPRGAPPPGANLALPKSVPEFSTPNLLAGLLFGSIGFVGFFYGRRMSHWKPMFLGIALMAYPYFVENTLILYGIGLAGTAALFLLGD